MNRRRFLQGLFAVPVLCAPLLLPSVLDSAVIAHPSDIGYRWLITKSGPGSFTMVAQYWDSEQWRDVDPGRHKSVWRSVPV
jgi:hypothetical protein